MEVPRTGRSPSGTSDRPARTHGRRRRRERRRLRRSVSCTTRSGHAVDTRPCCAAVMTTAPLLPTPEDATVVEVHGSRFVLEWLQRETLAGAAELSRRCADADPGEQSPAD